MTTGANRHPTFAALPPAMRARLDQLSAQSRDGLDASVKEARELLDKGLDPNEAIAVLTTIYTISSPLKACTLAATAVLHLATTGGGAKPEEGR